MVKAKLITRCGCSKEIATTYPPPLEIVVAMLAPMDYSNPRLLRLPPATRTFRREVFVNQGPDASVAEYREWYVD